MYDHLLPPIVNMLVTSEALLLGRYGALTADQAEDMAVIHACAVQTYTMTNQLLKQFDTAPEALLHRLSHDWLAPSANVVSHTDFLLEGMAGALTPQQTEKVRQVFYQAHLLRRQLYNLLDYARILREDRRPLVSFELASILNAELITIQSAVPIRYDVRADLPPVYSSKLYLARILSNLIANAVAATSQGYIGVRALVAGRQIEISVRDTGTGIPRQQWPQLFKPFTRLSERLPGAGLGLYIAQTFAQWQQGRLTLESVVGQGTTFILTVPLGLDKYPAIARHSADIRQP